MPVSERQYIIGAMSYLSIYAGPRAMQQIQANGLQAEHFKVLVGASGGPKWFVLYGLDRYLFGEFFANRSGRLATLGSSAGAWRLACLATDQPVAAIDRLASLYSKEQYSANPTVEEVSRKARVMLQRVLGPDGGSQLVNNDLIKTHIIAVRCKGFLNHRNNASLGVGLALAGISNLVSRRTLGLYFERAVFNNHAHSCELARLNDIKTLDIKLTEDNINDALLASGSIPLALEGVRDVDGGPGGLYIDGGITDYHFDVPFHANDGLVLYPHFFSRVVPGWFDKYLRWRKVERQHYDNVVLIAPSRQFVAALPHGKIPDRNDFRHFDFDDRVKYWRSVLQESERLAEEFAILAETGKGLDRIRLFDPAQRD